jgi:dTDP-4-dehydrorhamnose reductase
MQTILITGANGFVGFYLSQLLLRKGYKVIATGKGLNRLPFHANNFVYETMDFTNEESVKGVFDKYKPDVVIHSGAMSKPDECELNKEAAFLTNVTGTLYLLHAATQLKSFFLYISTDFVFEGASLNYTEEDVVQPVNYYGQSKVLAEEEVKKYGHGWSIVRTILVYGHPKSGRQNLLTMVATALKSGKEIKIVSDQTRKPTYVEDLAQAIVNIIEKRISGIFHICGKDVITPYQIACAVADYFSLDKSKIISITAASFKEPARRPPVTGFDCNKAKKELSYEPIAFKLGMEKTFED